jgi:hypothetical protein
MILQSLLSSPSLSENWSGFGCVGSGQGGSQRRMYVFAWLTDHSERRRYRASLSLMAMSVWMYLKVLDVCRTQK